MKNSILVAFILLMSFFAFQAFNKHKNKPEINYTLDSNYPAIAGDTVAVNFSFKSESNLKYFKAILQNEFDAIKDDDRVEFVPGKTEGDLTYKFIIPSKLYMASSIRFQFVVGNEISEQSVFLNLPVYNPPKKVMTDLEPSFKNEIKVQAFYTSKNLIMNNELLADISEVEGYSKFKLSELLNFSLENLNPEAPVIIKSNELIASNLIRKPVDLIQQKQNTLAAGFLDITDFYEVKFKNIDVEKSNEELKNELKQKPMSKIQEKDTKIKNKTMKRDNISTKPKKTVKTITITNDFSTKVKKDIKIKNEQLANTIEKPITYSDNKNENKQIVVTQEASEENFVPLENTQNKIETLNATEVLAEDKNEITIPDLSNDILEHNSQRKLNVSIETIDIRDETESLKLKIIAMKVE